MFNLPSYFQHPYWQAFFSAVKNEIDRIDTKPLVIYFIDSCSEEVLPFLARDFNIHNAEWSIADTIEKKRELIKNAWELHLYKGTMHAVKRVLELLNYTKVSKIEEWHEMGGNNNKPFSFSAEIDVSETGQTKLEWDMLFSLINEYKRAVDGYSMTIKLNNAPGEIEAAASTQISEFIITK